VLQTQPNETRQSDWSTQLQGAYQEVASAIDAIHAIPGYADFLQPLSFEQIGLAAGKTALIYILTTSQGGLALVVWQGQVEAIWLDNLTEKKIGDWLVERNKEEITGGYWLGTLADPAWLKDHLPALLDWLGENIFTSISKRLVEQGVERITLIPTGGLSLLPLHAANITLEGKKLPLLQRFSVSYVSSARALRACHTTAAERLNSQEVLAGVGNPLPTNPELDFARAELEEASKYFASSYPLYEFEATKAALFEMITKANHIHFACHGEFNPLEPLASYMVLADGDTLTMKEILDPQVKAAMSHVRLVVLSACQTAISDFGNLPDEAISMSSSFLQAGIPGVIGTLWQVNDLSTALVMAKFYEYHLSGAQLEPPEALRKAQLWLREVTVGELNSYFDSHIAFHEAKRTTLERIPEWVALQGKLDLSIYNDPMQKPYADKPYHWAPFVYFGI